jgi:methylmalonyl-CoA mutase N-terminal domain/subunit
MKPDIDSSPVMPGEKKIFTESGIEIKQVYTSHETKPEIPGEFPFTRGVQADMYRTKLWTMRQYAGFSTAEESNTRYKYLLGQTMHLQKEK